MLLRALRVRDELESITELSLAIPRVVRSKSRRRAREVSLDKVMESLAQPLKLITSCLNDRDLSALACTSSTIRKICSGLLSDNHFHLLRTEKLMHRSDPLIFSERGVDWKDVYAALFLARFEECNPYTPQVLRSCVCVKLLLSDEELSIPRGESSPFVTACSLGQLEVALLLLSSPRARPNWQEVNYALMKACIAGSISLVRLVLTLPDVDVMCRMSEPLIASCRNGHDDITLLLLSHPTAEELKRSRDRLHTIFRVSCRRSSLEIVAGLVGRFTITNITVLDSGFNIACSLWSP